MAVSTIVNLVVTVYSGGDINTLHGLMFVVLTRGKINILLVCGHATV